MSAAEEINVDIIQEESRDITLEEWRRIMAEEGFPAFRAGQIYRWLHKNRVEDAGEMTNLPESLRESLTKRYRFALPQIESEQVSREDGTRKYLLKLCDGNYVECVLMKYHFGNSLCISTQVGCRMGCRFCASTLGGLIRSLSGGEMLGEVYAVEKALGEPVTHVVLMGMGEPLDNYDAVVDFLRRIGDEDGKHLSRRNLTLSTCGIVPNMRKLAEEGLQVTLALSLHAAGQEEREQLLPIAAKYKLDEVLDACRYYFEKTGRRVSYEYALVKGQNDSPKDALRLAKLLKGSHGHVNLIPVNPVVERSWEQPSKKDVQKFCAILQEHGIAATVRREMGRDIDGACGQLRKRIIKENGLD